MWSVRLSITLSFLSNISFNFSFWIVSIEQWSQSLFGLIKVSNSYFRSLFCFVSYITFSWSSKLSRLILLIIYLRLFSAYVSVSLFTDFFLESDLLKISNLLLFFLSSWPALEFIKSFIIFFWSCVLALRFLLYS